MFILGIDCEGEEGLLRVEVLTILAAMKNRLAHSLLTDHIVFPVSEKGSAQEDLD